MLTTPYASWSVRYPNRRPIGYLCSYVPEEIIHAAGFTPIRVMPAASPVTRADAHLQSYTCSLARSCLDQALAGKLDFLEGVVLAHTCDTMQGLADIWHDAFPNLFVETIVGPVALNAPAAPKYLTAELRRFASSLEQHFKVSITEDKLRASIQLYNSRRRALAAFYARRDAYTAREWFDTITTAALTPPEEFSIANPQSPISTLPSTAFRILLLGSTIDEPTLPEILDELGARVVADDFCNGGRYFETPVAEDGEPFEALAARQFARPACPCKHRALDHRKDRLLQLVKAQRAQGVIFNLKKFCDPHAWDYVPLAAALAEAKVPYLLLETEQAAPAGPTRVRVEAFLEMLGQAAEDAAGGNDG